MSSPFIGEIRMVGFNFAPKGWAYCNGQLMPISQNTALFSLLGTYYGGDGRTTFALPNLQGSFPLGEGSGAGLSPRAIGQTGGEQSVTLAPTQMPAHTHTAYGGGAASSQNPANHAWGTTRGTLYNTSTPDVTMPAALTSSGGSLPHNNLPPGLALTFVIALQGIYPARS